MAIGGGPREVAYTLPPPFSLSFLNIQPSPYIDFHWYRTPLIFYGTSPLQKHFFSWFFVGKRNNKKMKVKNLIGDFSHHPKSFTINRTLWPKALSSFPQSHHGHLFSLPIMVLLLSVLWPWLCAPWSLPPSLHPPPKSVSLFFKNPPALQNWISFPASQELDEWYMLSLSFSLHFHGFLLVGIFPWFYLSVNLGFWLCSLLTCSDVGLANGAVFGICRS